MAQKAAIVILFTTFVATNRVIFGDMNKPLATYSIECNLPMSLGALSHTSITPPQYIINKYISTVYWSPQSGLLVFCAISNKTSI